MGKNIIKLTDSYKVTHFKQYPKDTEIVYSYFESRGGIFDYTIFYGLQYLLKEYIEGEVVSKKKIADAKKTFEKHFSQFNSNEIFNYSGWKYILEKHQGTLPVSIKAVPEGKKVGLSNTLITIENTDVKCYWLTNYLETLLVQVWYPTTVATLSNKIRNLILEYLNNTGNPELVDIKLHDFGFRGSSSVETASIGGSAHLLNFKGTDTLASLDFINKYYKPSNKNYSVAGFSIPASEHSTMTAWGKENEDKAMENMLNSFPSGTIACVSDSFDIFYACEKIWGDKLKEKVISRDGVLVIRPDSGDPPEIVCKVLDILGEKFGYEYNKKNYKVLNPKVRVIQGDGVSYKMIHTILDRMSKQHWSTDNINFGMGSGLLQKVNRDTLEFAFKCSAVRRDGKWFDVFKKPVTDLSKQSKRGRLKLIKSKNGLETVNFDEQGEDKLVEVFRNGKILKEYDFDEIRENVLQSS